MAEKKIKKGDTVLLTGSRVFTVLSVSGDLIRCYDKEAFRNDEVVPLFVINKKSIMEIL